MNKQADGGTVAVPLTGSSRESVILGIKYREQE